MQLISNDLLSYLLQRFKLDWFGLHGVQHWIRVHDNGLWLSSFDSEINPTIVMLFGILHDSCRLFDDEDIDHGSRASQLVEELNGEFFHISDEEKSSLCYACLMHSYPLISFDPTVGACWDADRLELSRAGIEINPKYLSTQIAKDYINSFDF